MTLTCGLSSLSLSLYRLSVVTTFFCHQREPLSNMGVSKNRGGPPKSSILIGFSIIKHPFWGPTPIFGLTPIWKPFCKHHFPATLQEVRQSCEWKPFKLKVKIRCGNCVGHMAVICSDYWSLVSPNHYCGEDIPMNKQYPLTEGWPFLNVAAFDSDTISSDQSLMGDKQKKHWRWRRLKTPGILRNSRFQSCFFFFSGNSTQPWRLKKQPQIFRLAVGFPDFFQN